jgi:mannitol/fructose-specific phosphotransferase system IIA component (Ntr-type)
MSRKENRIRGLEEEIDLLDDMLTALVAVLAEKGVITNQEWEEKIKNRIKGKPSKSFRDL